jgi:alanyl-tRNA synthetase
MGMGAPPRPKPKPSQDPDDLPNKTINQSSSFIKVHNKYTGLTKTNSCSSLPNPDREEYIKSLEKKLKASESETQLLKNKLKMTELENSELTKLLNRIKRDHMIKLQTVQEQHERKLQKTKRDLDYLLKEMNNRSNMIILEDFIKIHMAEMEKCRLNYEEIFKSFVKQVSSQEGGNECLDSISMSLEQKLEDELNHIKDRYEYQIEKLKECVTNESIEDFEDELSTRLNSERATSEMKGSLLEHTVKLSYKSPKSSFYHN